MVLIMEKDKSKLPECKFELTLSGLIEFGQYIYSVTGSTYDENADSKSFASHLAGLDSIIRHELMKHQLEHIKHLGADKTFSTFKKHQWYISISSYAPENNLIFIVWNSLIRIGILKKSYDKLYKY
jgi:hypothetical protein